MEKFRELGDAIQTLAAGNDLSVEASRACADALFAGQFHEVQFGCLMMGLRRKGETASEILGLLSSYLDQAVIQVDEGFGEGLVDVCGTGGDGPSADVFNISTTAMIVAAAGGARIAKHGTSAVSSQSGSTEVQQALGLKIPKTKDEVLLALAKHGLCYVHGPFFNRAMANVIEARRRSGMRSVFNLLGPLSNPLRPSLQLLGVYNTAVLTPVAEVLLSLGRKRALVVSARDGLDELSVVVPTDIREVRAGKIVSYSIDPVDFFGRRASYEELRGGDPRFNARKAEEILGGMCVDGGRDVVALNAGAALYLSGLGDSLRDGVSLAIETIKDGRARAKLESLRSNAHTEGSANG
ncbi:anthranilate phosphoribosyltransferase [Rhizobium leguminosarum]|uniref:anthranilate phosphoribosyltransferase n=1 Tax=Rhizobium leguminosarum TaxID=384 RepID=UPI001F36FEC3|nr:anthranilate phosphoribosyltransferase [Rhizobium leguminosarum]UIJ83173.1 anthranilate phosphoribosyltransferase [Rhizobium leguminosarum]